MKISEFDINVSMENVLHIMDCYPDSPFYLEVIEEYKEMLPEAYQKIEPQAALDFGIIPSHIESPHIKPGNQALYVITTIGKKMNQWSTDFFHQGDYLKGMLADAIADDYLFQMDHLLKEDIIKLCKEKGMGVTKRLEAPNGVPLSIQKTAFDIVGAKENLNMSIKESFMLDPVKSNCQVYLLEEGLQEYHIHHNCNLCGAHDCKMRNRDTNDTALA